MRKQKMFKMKTIFPVLFMAFTAFTLVNKVKDNSYVSTQAWSGTQTPYSGSYYNSIGSQTGSSLKSALQGIISSGTNESYDWERYEAADEAEGQSSSVLLIYSRKVVNKTDRVAGSKGWNREHSFAKSLFNEAAPAVNDNHHIFADDNKTNSARGNKPFGEVDQTSGNRVTDGYGNTTDNYTTSSYFYPNELARGEVARATMYMNTRYGYNITLNFQSIALMLKWHIENPVTNREIYRNNIVHSLQGNRNPFIDNPSYACKIWSGTNSATEAECANEVAPVTPTGITLSEWSATLNVGNTLGLSATVYPVGVSQKVTWSSNAPWIASVSSSGVVTPVSIGTATITATSSVNSNIKAKATITVTDDPIPVNGVSFDSESSNIKLSNTLQLEANVSPSSATNKDVMWASSNSNVASVNSNGLVTGNSIGSATISATTVEGNFKASTTIIVSNAGSVQTSVVGSFYNNTSSNNGSTKDLNYTHLNNGLSDYDSTGFGGIEVLSDFSRSGTVEYPRGGGLAIGSNGNSATATFSFNEQYKPQKVELLFNGSVSGAEVSAVEPNSGVSKTLISNGSLGTQYQNPSNGTPYIYEFSEPITTLSITASKRLILVQMTLYYGEEDTSGADALAWANSFLDLTEEGCAFGDLTILNSVWPQATSDYDDLSEDAKAIIEGTVANGNGGAIEEALARYTIIVTRYGKSAFISGYTISNSQSRDNKSNQNNYLFAIIGGMALMGFIGYAYLQKKRKA